MRSVIRFSLLALLAAGFVPVGGMMSASAPCAEHGGVVLAKSTGCQSAPCCLMAAPRRDDGATTIKHERSLPSIPADVLRSDNALSEDAIFYGGDARTPRLRSQSALVLRL